MRKTIKLNRKNRDKLKTIDEYSIEKNLNTLMDIVENKMPFVRYTDKMTSINVHSATVERLDSFRICNGESRDSIITRMLLCLDEIKPTPEENYLWIPFKLTSTLNKQLSIKCIYEINTSVLMFDEGNEIYSNDLPITYKVNGEDLSIEFHSWISMLNFNEILDLVSKNNKDLFTLKQKDYYLEVNYL